MTSAEVRTSFLKFFEERGHQVVASDSLVPSTDPTLLFTSAGMVQFKPNFQNPSASPYPRAASCQKCLRTSDIERVGTTLRHLTFFEMLGNFSFGDYFKKESIAWGWEFLTKTMGLPGKNFVVSVHKGDDEAFGLWEKLIPKDKIYRLDDDTNFWTMGPTGPCGPCSEILWDRGASWSCGKPTCSPACDCDRYLEIWNHVFTQFDRGADGKLTPLPKKNIDTGMGLERLTVLAQGVESPFETDTFQKIFKDLAKISGKDPKADANKIAFRRIADHARAVTFMISDGILPSNEGRGYVLRRLLRQAVRGGKTLGIHDPFFHQLSGTVVDLMKDAYPNTEQHRKTIDTVIRQEEEKFLETLDAGTRRIDELMSTAKTAKKTTLAGEDVFQLYDTYGFPLELTKEIAEPRGFKIDEAAFKKAQEAASETARQGWKGSGSQNVDHYRTWKTAAALSTVFRGYDVTELESTLVKPFYKKTEKGWTSVDSLSAGDEAEVVCKETPFFAERGGQVGDTGTIETADGTAEVLDTQAPVPEFNVQRIRVTKGTLKVGTKASLKVDVPRRQAIARHHTATHILHQALRDMFGTQLTQAGSLVAPDRLRFDFTHSKPLSIEERQRLEDTINDKIIQDIRVTACSMTKDQAQKVGALMLFGEKYGEQVRAVMISPHDCARAKEAWSLELCGGTHVPATGSVGFFKIVGQSSVSAGVRRVEALAGPVAMRAVWKMEQQMSSLAETLKTVPDDLSARVDKVLAEEKQLKKEIQQLKSGANRNQFDDIAKSAYDFGGSQVISKKVDGVDEKQLREVADRLRDGSGMGLVLLASVNDDRVSFVVSIQKTLTERGWNAGQVAKEFAAQIDGSAGGRPDFAQGGGKNVGALEKALADIPEILKRLVIKAPHKPS